ncbi:MULTISPECIES: hypothetical protein [Streptomyces]|nr:MULTISPECIES: hypothetical protein [Streptomyces]
MPRSSSVPYGGEHSGDDQDVVPFTKLPKSSKPSWRRTIDAWS